MSVLLVAQHSQWHMAALFNFQYGKTSSSLSPDSGLWQLAVLHQWMDKSPGAIFLPSDDRLLKLGTVHWRCLSLSCGLQRTDSLWDALFLKQLKLAGMNQYHHFSLISFHDVFARIVKKQFHMNESQWFSTLSIFPSRLSWIVGLWSITIMSLYWLR